MKIAFLDAATMGDVSFEPFERLGDIRFVDDGFTIENGLMTFTAKIRKNVVFDKYEKLINEMYKM